ncbi:hypothetical protein K488DRAFT_69807 [Vararia minispora EC-137]|uniref:Uncharacterized protein n=1 Tax=Vararia minispora EC-137 TaxID=1314806 RepID=A0ACB8QPT2_9AGAM|nr:hypothetical protein K488DRAFT_69807 [Vararia minispora EC-137]
MHHAHPSAYGLPALSYDSYSGPDHRVPTVGQTRCYWTLVSSALTFVYLDPVLAHHLQDQAELLIGKSIIDFVHQDEQQSAQRDLTEVFHSGNLDGTLTRQASPSHPPSTPVHLTESAFLASPTPLRMRFSRLSRVRRLLGYRGPLPHWPDADKIAIDADYMAVDLIVNVAADDLLLCFIHAAVDLTPHDNDERHKSSWSNWCGTDAFTAHQVPDLFDRLCRAVSPSTTMSRVFQIFAAAHSAPHTLLFSWPPEPQSGHGPSARDFARLSDGVNIDSQSIVASTAKTACTRRFKVGEQPMNAQDAYRLVDSVFIPHGSIIFACHQVKCQDRPSTMPVAATATSTHPASLHSLYITQPHQQLMGSSFATSLGAFPQLPTPPPPQSLHQPHSQSYTWQTAPTTMQSTAETSSSYGTWTSSPASFSSTPTSAHPTPSYTPRPTQPPQQPQPAPSQPQPPPPPAPASWPYVCDSQPYRAASPQPYYSAPVEAAFDEQSSAPPAAAPPTPPRPHRTSPGATRDGPASTRSGNPPAGVSRCSSCKVAHSPEWRKGPSGKKDLCNACGLRFARSRAKKEGVPTQRRKRENAKGGQVKRIEVPLQQQQQQQQQPVGAEVVSGVPVPLSYRRDSYEAQYSIGGSPSEYASASVAGQQQQTSVASTPSPPVYAQQAANERYYQHQHPHQQLAQTPVHARARAHNQTQLPPFHELPHTHTLSPSLPARPPF